MPRFLLTRAIQSILTLCAVTVVVFLASRASGDPILLMAPPDATQDDLAILRRQLGLDRSIPEQYWNYLTNLAHGNLGESIRNGRPVTELIAQRWPNSARLGLIALGISLTLAFVLGVTASAHPATWLDRGVKMLAVLGQSLPSFLVAIVAIDIFSVRLRLVPPGEMGGPIHYILPAFCLGTYSVAGTMRLLRSSMLNELDSEYIKLARVKGLPERLIIWKHALRNALIPVLTAAGMQFAQLITGALIIETVFAWPGLGRLAFEAVMNRDFPVIQGTVLVVAIIVVTVNLTVDCLYACIDPRIRHHTC
jgi:ABC-type dipeptide/oligopeptide/nickel transport system permease component